MDVEEKDWFTIENIHEIDTPALVIYPARVRQNIDVLKSILPDTKRLRPHIKTNKSFEASRLLLEAGISRFKCATIAEAEMLATAGAPDVMLGYQPVGPKVRRLAQLTEAYPRTTFTCLVDNRKAAAFLSSEFADRNKKINVCIDLNVGMNRTGIIPSQAVALAASIHNLPGIRFVGLHVYDGHIRDRDFSQRTRHCDEAFAAVEELRKTLEQTYGPLLVVAGGTPTFPIHAKRENVECSPGTFIFWDWGYQENLQEQPFVFAALIITRVISNQAPGLICVDLGHKSIAAENPLSKRVHFLNAPGCEPVGQSEEHLVLQLPVGSAIDIGEVLYGVPYHICPTCALFDSAWAVENHKVSSSWEIAARKRKINI